MQPIGDIRRERLRQLIEKFGSLAELNEKLGRTRTDATLSQIVNRSKDSRTGKPKQMGDALARSIEAGLKLQPGWMDAPSESPELMPLSPEARAVAIALDEFDRESRDHVIRMCMEAITFARRQNSSSQLSKKSGH